MAGLEGEELMSTNLSTPDVRAEVAGGVGLITLHRPRALNALSLDMVRALTAVLLAWRDDASVLAVAVRGSTKDPQDPAGAVPFGAFCAGGDIRFFHQAALAGDPRLEDFFTEEYALNHLIHTYGKPYIAFMDGIVMGGGMGISQGASLRLVTERTKMAMPETNIGLFPDVGGGYFLSRCPGHIGEYLALTGEVIGPTAAVRAGLADLALPSAVLPDLWRRLGKGGWASGEALQDWLRAQPTLAAEGEALAGAERTAIDRVFALPSVRAIIEALESATHDAWSQAVASSLRKRSPLMLHVVLEQVRRGRSLTLAQDLRLERDLVRHCFHLRPGQSSETVEGIRALAVDKDHAPRWNPARIEDVEAATVQAFFVSPWPTHAHPLARLA
jgi:enoyl-CoA hydratase/carnithine racemase